MVFKLQTLTRLDNKLVNVQLFGGKKYDKLKSNKTRNKADHSPRNKKKSMAATETSASTTITATQDVAGQKKEVPQDRPLPQNPLVAKKSKWRRAFSHHDVIKVPVVALDAAVFQLDHQRHQSWHFDKIKKETTRDCSEQLTNSAQY